LAFLDEPATFTFPEPDSTSVHCYRNDRGLDVHCIKLPVFVDVVTSELASPRAVMGGLSMRAGAAGAGFLSILET
jgi:hypothetical protein